MTDVILSQHATRNHDWALQTLERFAAAAGITFDRFLAARALSEAGEAIPGHDWISWSRRLVEVGESLQLRIRSFEASLAEVAVYLQQSGPIATCVPSVDGALTWIVFDKAKGRRLRQVSTTEGEFQQWLSPREIRHLLNLQEKTGTCRWVIGQAAYSAGGPSRTLSNSQGNAHPPLHRLLRFIRPEKKDLWVVVVFSLVVGVLTLATPIAVEALVNTVAFGQFLQPVVILALMLFVFLGFAAAMRALITFVVEIIQRRLFIRVVEDLAFRFPRVQSSALENQSGPELANRFFDVVTVQKTTSALLLDGITIILQTVIGMAVLAFYHPFLLGFDIVLLASIGFTTLVLGRGAVASAISESKAKYAIAAWLEELPRHPTAFKFHGGQRLAAERADQLAVDWLDYRRKHFRILMRQILFALGLQAIAATVLLGLGGWLVIIGELTLGQLVAAELIVTVIVGSFAKLGKHLESFYDLLASVDKLGVLFDLPVEPHDRLLHGHSDQPAMLSAREVRYNADDGGLTGPVNLEIHRGEKVALLGPTGTGKTLLMQLITGLKNPTGGQILLDEIDLRELRPDSLREHLSLAGEVEVFRGTLDENIHLGRSHISARDVRDALKTVGLLDDVLSLPEGLKTELQTGGFPLSESQAALLMLARAVVGRPRLLLIDGTLDRLDDATQNQLVEHFTDSKAPWTLVLTTRQAKIAERCDRVIHLSRDFPLPLSPTTGYLDSSPATT
jgi:putative ABC transport system ATP-binding protein